MSAVLTFVAFWGLVAFTASASERRAELRAKPMREWVLDVTGLLIQGMVIPMVGVAVLSIAYSGLFPNLRGALHLPWPLAFAVAFIAVDYIYYWNHRLLHTRSLWPTHVVHHTARHLDVFVTSRNTLWTSAIMIYLWASSFFAYVLDDPSGYLAGAAVTAVLDLARHAPIDLSRWPLLERVLGAVFVLPRDHAIHHADLEVHGNYSANFILWDRLHGTYLGRRAVPSRLGVEHSMTLAQAMFWPHGAKPSESSIRAD